MAAELRHRGLERYTCSRRRLLEDHRQRAIAERRIGRAVRLQTVLDRDTALDQVVELVGGEIQQGQKMACAHERIPVVALAQSMRQYPGAPHGEIVIVGRNRRLSTRSTRKTTKKAPRPKRLRRRLARRRRDRPVVRSLQSWPIRAKANHPNQPPRAAQWRGRSFTRRWGCFQPVSSVEWRHGHSHSRTREESASVFSSRYRTSHERYHRSDQAADQ